MQRAKIYIAFDNSFLTENSDFPKSEGPKSPKPKFPGPPKTTRISAVLGSTEIRKLSKIRKILIFRLRKLQKCRRFWVGRSPELLKNRENPDLWMVKNRSTISAKSENWQKITKSKKVRKFLTFLKCAINAPIKMREKWGPKSPNPKMAKIDHN